MCLFLFWLQKNTYASKDAQKQTRQDFPNA